MKDKEKNLYYLNELSDYKVASGDPDVRGWKVNDREKRTIGKIDNLLVNPTSERVVYLDVEVDDSIIEANHKPYSNSAKSGAHEFLNKDGENHLIIPIGLATLDKDNEIVNTDSIDYQTFAESKRFKKGDNIDRDYEIVVLDNYNRDQTQYPEDDSLYERKEFKRNS
ncbi:MAG: photosystem reaction center subunit H [Flavobacteriaceae bacterium]